MLLVILLAVAGCATTSEGSGGNVWLGRGPVTQQDEFAMQRAAEAEVARVVEQIGAVVRDIDLVGTRLTLTFWSERGALTWTAYESRERVGHRGGPVGAADTRGALREVLAGYGLERTGQVVLSLRREETQWSVDYAFQRHAERPPEAVSGSSKMDHPILSGFDRLLSVCKRESLEMSLTAPSQHPLKAGQGVGGHSLDPMLAAFYSKFGSASFADDAYVLRVNDDENQLEEKNHSWRESWQKSLGLTVCVFGGESNLAYYFATVPGLADARGCQPVVEVDTYELDGPVIVPLASNVDRFFDLYARYLEELVAHEDYAERGAAALGFPWKVPHLLARDERLVQLIEEGRFDFPQASHDARAWVHKVLEARRHIT